MQTVMESKIARVQSCLREEFPHVLLEFATQVFSEHVELWVYVLNMDEYDRVRAKCGQLSRDMGLEQSEPEIWLLAKTWTGPWIGGESEENLRSRREEFKAKHNIKI